MPKSPKQKTKVKKQTKRSTKKSYERIPVVSLLESPPEEDFVDVSEERTSILAIVKDLEGQVDTAYQLKEILEAELDAVTKERDSLAEEADSAKSLTKEFEGEKVALEAQVMNLKDKIADMDNLRSEFDETIETRKNLDEQFRAFSSRLEGAEKSNKVFEEDLTAAQKQVESLQEKIMLANSRVAEIRAQLEEQQATNGDIMEANTRLENEIKTSKVSYDAAKNELEAFKTAMHDIHSEASRTSGRVRQRYFKLKNKK